MRERLDNLPNEQKLGASIRLARALSHMGRYEESHAILSKVRPETKVAGTNFFARMLYVSLPAAIFHKNWDEAEKILEEFEALENPPHLYRSLIRNLKVSLYLHRFGLAHVESKIERIRSEAKYFQRWEILRNVDRWVARATGSHEIASLVYFGSPYATFRKIVRNEMKSELLPTFVWSTSQSENPKVALDLSAEPSQGNPRPEIDSMNDRLIAILSSDFYRPFPVATLFEKLFPGEPFSLDTSATRVHQIVRRLRKHFEEKRLPFYIFQNDSGYRIASKTSGFGIKVPEPGTKLTRETLFLDRLRRFSEDGKKPFTIRELIDWLGMPKSSVHRFLQEELSKGTLLREGSGRSSFYRLKK